MTMQDDGPGSAVHRAVRVARLAQRPGNAEKKSRTWITATGAVKTVFMWTQAGLLRRFAPRNDAGLMLPGEQNTHARHARTARRANLPHAPGVAQKPKSAACSHRSVPARGALRDRHERRVRNAMDAPHRLTSDVVRGRRSRVVLTRQGRCQVGDDALHRADDGGNQARSPGRARRKPLKPLRRECR
jgi:hypothetical protein